jgi:hypothetical protein
MKRREKQSDALRTALDAWDPVRREGEASDDQVAEVRRRVIAAGSASTLPGVERWRPVLAAAAAVALAVVLLHDGVSWTPASSPPAPAPHGAPEALGGERAAAFDGEEPAAVRAQAEAPRRVESPPSVQGGEGGEGGRTGGGAGVADGPPHRQAVVERFADVATAAIPRQAAAAASPSGPVDGDAVPGGAAGAAAASRQIHLIAPGGTRIVWLVAVAPERSTDSSEEDT